MIDSSDKSTVPEEPIQGLLNKGRQCFMNSVFQALFYCDAFKNNVNKYSSENDEDSLLTSLSDLFQNLSDNSGCAKDPKMIIKHVNKLTDQFRCSDLEHDAQEFLIFFLNEISRLVNNRGQNSDSTKTTWIEDIFQGILINKTQCLSCKKVSQNEEVFLDLSLDVEPDCSINYCLKQFCKVEKLDQEALYHCENCGKRTEALKQMGIKKLPSVLILHLKRFQSDTHVNTKLSFPVHFSTALKLSNIYENCENPDCKYLLFAVIVHVGVNLDNGHYVAVVKKNNKWILCNDNEVKCINFEHCIPFLYGRHQNYVNECAPTAYILLYQYTNL